MKSPRKRAISKAKFYEEVYDNMMYWTWRLDGIKLFDEVDGSKLVKNNKTRIMGVDVV